MTKFNDYLNEQLRDPTLKKEYNVLEPEFSVVQAAIDAGKDVCTSEPKIEAKSQQK